MRMATKKTRLARMGASPRPSRADLRHEFHTRASRARQQVGWLNLSLFRRSLNMDGPLAMWPTARAVSASKARSLRASTPQRHPWRGACVKNNFRWVPERAKPKVKRSYCQRIFRLAMESRMAIVSNDNGPQVCGVSLVSCCWRHPLALLWALF